VVWEHSLVVGERGVRCVLELKPPSWLQIPLGANVNTSVSCVKKVKRQQKGCERLTRSTARKTWASWRKSRATCDHVCSQTSCDKSTAPLGHQPQKARSVEYYVSPY
jgi:hypothetical protein